MKIAYVCSRIFVLSNMTAEHTYKFLPPSNVLRYSLSVQIGILHSKKTHEQPFPLTFFLSRRLHAWCCSSWLELWLSGLPRFVPRSYNLGISRGLCDNNHGYTLDHFPYAITKQTPVGNGRLISKIGNVFRTYNRIHTIKCQIPLPWHINLSPEELLTDCRIFAPSVASCS